MKFLLTFFIALMPFICEGRALLLPNEVAIFSFTTTNGKAVMLAKDKGDAYIIYRFGTNAKVDFEYPEKTSASWKKFKYSYYLRGGGIQNEGMDLNYVSFTNNGYRYVIYNTYYAVGEKQAIGIKVINPGTQKSSKIKGIYKTRKGTIVDFRFNDKLEVSDELFD